MAITFRGGASTPLIFGNDATTQNLFALENGATSRVNVLVRALHVSQDAVVALAAVMPLVKVYRATAISNGATLPKSTYDSTLSSDAAVTVRSAILEGAPIIATPGDCLAQRFVTRLHTAVENVTDYAGEGDLGLLPEVLESKDFVLRPGQSLLVRMEAAVGTSNAAITNSLQVTCAWEEDPIATFAISGTVTLSGSPVTGAIVTVIEADDVSMTNAHVRAVITTPAGGAWASTIRTGKVGAAFVQYESGGTKYTAPGSPYLA